MMHSVQYKEGIHMYVFLKLRILHAAYGLVFVVTEYCLYRNLYYDDVLYDPLAMMYCMIPWL